MNQVHLDLPELGFIIGTRAFLGAGIALLLSDCSIGINEESLEER